MGTCLSVIINAALIRGDQSPDDEAKVAQPHNAPSFGPSSLFSMFKTFGHQPSNASDNVASTERLPNSLIQWVIIAVPLASGFLYFLYNKYYGALGTENGRDRIPIIKRVVYRVEAYFSRYHSAKPLALIFATLSLVLSGALVLYVTGSVSFVEALWLSGVIVADAFNLTAWIGNASRTVSLIIRSGGMLLFAIMLGFVSDAISAKIDSLRKGKTEVVEINHILILGWSDKLTSLLKELVLANQSVGGGMIVVLAERDKEEMEADISKLECSLMETSITCRSGNPLILADLKKISVSMARAIIILASDGNAEQSDKRALRIVLSLTGMIEEQSGHIVVEINDPNKERIFKLVGGNLIEVVVANSVIGRLMIHWAVQPGLAKVWQDIMGFENNKLYVTRCQKLNGTRFRDVWRSLPTAIPFGVRVHAEDGRIILNPDGAYVLGERDEILVIARDDGACAPTDTPIILPQDFWVAEIQRGYLNKDQKKILFCGWCPHIDDVIEVLDKLVAPGSELWMFNELGQKESQRRLLAAGLNMSRLRNIKIVFKAGNAVIRPHLEQLHLASFHSILILADNTLDDSFAYSDSQSLMTLLLIRDIELATLSSDYILPNELVSMALAMVAENREINRVFEDLFAKEGENEISFRPALFYLAHYAETTSFYKIVYRANRRQEIVIGYRNADSGVVTINPQDKAQEMAWCRTQNHNIPLYYIVVISRKARCR